METTESCRITTSQLVEALAEPDAYASGEDVSVRQTHISWIFLVGDYVYKIKKPIKTSFLDYSTLARREHFCKEEIRLDRRYADDLYIGVVPIVMTEDGVRVEADGEPIEWAVKMRRFPEHALLSEQLSAGTVSIDEVLSLADVIAQFHEVATRASVDQPWGDPNSIIATAIENFADLKPLVDGQAAKTLHVLKRWTEDYFDTHRPEFRQRVANGFIRECHGDLHLANIVQIENRFIPFDGIEFNDQFRWIDVLSDAAFTAMDFAACDHLELSRSFINAYLEQTGDHASPSLLRWYLVFRALVRAKVAAIKSAQPEANGPDAMADCRRHIDLAYRFSLRQNPFLWITHGVSGSGKTTASERIVQQAGAIRLRSDIERKRHFGLAPTLRLSARMKKKVYCDSANHATYARLRRLATGILRAGYPVVVDATFLNREDRQRFQNLAEQEGASFVILDCQCNTEALRQRITRRAAQNVDASEADLQVLEDQLASQQPLTRSERAYTIDAGTL